MPKEKVSPKSSGAGKWKKVLRVMLGLGVLGTVVAFAAGPPKPKVRELMPDEPAPQPGPQPGPPAASVPGRSAPVRNDDSFPLGYRSRGERVKLVQIALNRVFGEKLRVDGYWGDNTEAAMQRAHRQKPALVPATTLSEGMYANLEKAYAGKGLGATRLPLVYALSDTVLRFPQSGKTRLVRAGQPLGEHLTTRGAVTEVRSSNGEMALVSSLHSQLR